MQKLILILKNLTKVTHYHENNSLVFIGQPLQCYYCNSVQQPGCGDPFDPTGIAQLNCTALGLTECVKGEAGK